MIKEKNRIHNADEVRVTVTEHRVEDMTFRELWDRTKAEVVAPLWEQFRNWLRGK